MFRISYVSRVAAGFDDAALAKVLAVARRNNMRDGITGMMVFHAGCVLQILEGPEEKVTACYDRICDDKRHSGIAQMDKRQVAERAFSDWSMGVASPEVVKNMSGVSLHSLEEINARLAEVSAQNLAGDTLHLVMTMRKFMARMRIRDLMTAGSQQEFAP